MPRILAVFVLCSLLLSAKPKAKGGALYHDFVKRAASGDLSMDFRAFRFSCLDAEDCVPGGEINNAIAMRRAMQSKDYATAIREAETLIGQGYVNIEAHTVCAQAYAAMDNTAKATFHHQVAASLIRSILSAGDGKSKETAFEVIGTSEEYLILTVLGLPNPEAQALKPGKPHSYDVLTTKDPKTGEKVMLYFNIDGFYPMKGL